MKFIVLRKIRFGESDLILHGLSTNGSKLPMIARGALNSRKRFGGGVLEPTHYLSGEIASKNKFGQRELYTLKEAHIIEDFSQIKANYDNLELAFHFLSLVDQVSQEEDVDAENVFHLLGNALKALSQVENKALMRLQFELKLLNYLGVLPVIEEAIPFLKIPMGQVEKELSVISDKSLWSLERQSQDFLDRYRKGLAGH